MLPYPEDARHNSLAADAACHFDAPSLTASQVGRSGSLALTNFRIHEDGLTRILIYSKAALPSQNGRLTHRIIELETYRMMALLALPEAKMLLKKLPLADTKLTKLTRKISIGDTQQDELLLEDLHEQSITSLPSIGGMLNRRLEPGRRTCDAVFRWLDQLSKRVAQASQLLRTRIDVRHEKQNQEILTAMIRGFQLQLRLQQAAELLSVAIFT